MAIRLLTPECHGTLSFLTSAALDFIASEKERAEYSEDIENVDFLNIVKRGNDNSFPEPHHFSWESDTSADKFRITVNDESGRAIRFIETTELSHEMPYLAAGKRFTWYVTAYCGNVPVEVSEIGEFSTAMEAPRFIRVDGTTNVRDCGGWLTKSGKRIVQGNIFRGSGLDNAECDVTEDGRNTLLNEMHIKVDLDMRNYNETPRDYAGVLSVNGVVRKHIPQTAYFHIFHDEGRTMMRDFFRELCDPANYPCYIHCWGGADRTGTIAYLLEAVLGVPQETLTLDYELTSLAYWGPRYRKIPDFAQFETELAELYGYDGADRSTQAERYLLDIGITPAEIETLRRANLE